MWLGASNTAWIESHQSLPSNRKTLRACSILGIEPWELIGRLHLVWYWALDNATPLGELRDVTPGEIEIIACWRGEPGAFSQALLTAGFLERDATDQLVLHDWWDYAGKLGERRENTRRTDRNRQAAYRARRAKEQSGADAPMRDQEIRHADVTHTQPEGHADVTRDVTPRHAPTQPNPTEPNREGKGGRGKDAGAPVADAPAPASPPPPADAGPPTPTAPGADASRNGTPPEIGEVLARLRSLPSYPGSVDDPLWLQQLAHDHPDLDLAPLISDCAEWFASRPRRGTKPNWRSRIRNWAAKEERMRSGQPARASPDAAGPEYHDIAAEVERWRSKDARTGTAGGASPP